MNKEELENKYKTELELLKKHISNDYIYNIIMYYKTEINGVIYKLNSNINVYEMCFLSKMIDINKSTDILEIGCANGVSGMVIINALLKNNGGSLVSIDPFQTVQWKDVGKYNIEQIIKLNKTDKKINYQLIQELSSNALNNFVQTNKYFDLIFIDGSHGFLDVIIDIFCSIKILKKNGIMILDDVLHTGVKQVVEELINFKNLEKIHIEEKNNIYNIVKSNYRYKDLSKSFTNPRTMYAYKKI
jgi:predicted O-methyltransferase YrrM